MVLEEIACEQGPSHPVLSIEALEEEARLEYLAGSAPNPLRTDHK